MIRIEISHGARTLLRRHLPTDWQELNAKALEACAAVVFDPAISEAQQRARLLRILLIRGWWDIRAQWALFRADRSELAAVADRLKLFTSSFNMTGWTHERLYGRRMDTVLLAPESMLINLTLEEFTLAEQMAARFSQSGKLEDIERLMGVLYRPKSSDPRIADSRQPFARARMADYEQTIARQPRRRKLAVLINYMGNRNALMAYFPRIFPKPEPGKKADEQGQSKTKSAWQTLHLDLAREMHLSFEDAKRMNTFDVLTYLDQRVLENAKRKNRKANAR